MNKEKNGINIRSDVKVIHVTDERCICKFESVYFDLKQMWIEEFELISMKFPIDRIGPKYIIQDGWVIMINNKIYSKEIYLGY